MNVAGIFIKAFCFFFKAWRICISFCDRLGDADVIRDVYGRIAMEFRL
jgi:hypothetical protein